MNLDDKLNIDERFRLKLELPEGMKHDRDIYKGNDLKPSYVTNVQGYHILNELMIDRGPSPFGI